MYIIIHNNEDGDGAWSRIVELGKDVALPPLTFYQSIEPVVFADLVTARIYVLESLGWEDEDCPVADIYLEE